MMIIIHYSDFNLPSLNMLPASTEDQTCFELANVTHEAIVFGCALEVLCLLLAAHRSLAASLTLLSCTCGNSIPERHRRSYTKVIILRCPWSVVLSLTTTLRPPSAFT